MKKEPLYSLLCKVSSSVVTLLHLEPPHAYTTARRNDRPHSFTVFELCCVSANAAHNTHSSVVSSRKALMLFISTQHVPQPTLLCRSSADVTRWCLRMVIPLEMACMIFGNHRGLLMADVSSVIWPMCGNLGQYYVMFDHIFINIKQ